MQTRVYDVLDAYLAGQFDLTLLLCMRLNGAMPIELHTVLDIIDGKEPDDGLLDAMYDKYYGIRIRQ